MATNAGGQGIQLNIAGKVDLSAGNVGSAQQAIASIGKGFENAQKAASSIVKTVQSLGSVGGPTKSTAALQAHAKASQQAAQSVRLFGTSTSSTISILNQQAAAAQQAASVIQRSSTNMASAMRGVVAAFNSSDLQAKDYLQAVQSSMAARLAGVWAALRYARQAGTAMEEMDMLRASLTRMQGQLSANQLMEKGTEIAQNYGASLVDVTKAIAELTRQGRSTSDIAYLSESMAQIRLLLATSTGKLTPMADMIEHVTVLMNQLNVSAQEASRGLSLMAELDIRTATSLDKIGTALSKFAATGKVARMTMDEIIMAASAFTEVGFSGEQAGTALNTILSRVGRNTEALSFMKQFNVGLITMKDGVYTTNSSLNMLVETFQALKQAGRYADMKGFLEMFAGTRMQSKLVAGLEAYIRQTDPKTGTYAQILKQLADNDALEQTKRVEAMNTMLDTIGEKKVQIQNAFNSMFVTPEFTDFYKGVLDALTSVASTFGSLITTSVRGIMGAIGFGDIQRGLTNLATLFELYLLYKIPSTIVGGIKYLTASSVQALTEFATKIDASFRGIRFQDSSAGEGIVTTTKKLGARLAEARLELNRLTKSFSNIPTTAQNAQYSLTSLWDKSADAMNRYADSIRDATLQAQALANLGSGKKQAATPATTLDTITSLVPATVPSLKADDAKTWMKGFAQAARTELTQLKAQLQAMPLLPNVAQEYQKKFTAAEQEVKKVITRMYRTINTAASKGLVIDTQALKTQAMQAFNQINSMQSQLKTVPLQWDTSLARAEMTKLMSVFKSEIDTISSVFGGKMSSAIPPVIANQIQQQIDAMQKAYAAAEKKMATVFDKTTGNLVDPAKLQQIVASVTVPLQTAVRTISTNMNALLSGQIIPGFKQGIGEIEQGLARINGLLATPGVQRSGMVDIFREQAVALEGNKKKVEELLAALQSLPKNASPAAVTAKVQELANAIQYTRSEVGVLETQMTQAMRSMATAVAQVGAKLLSWISIIGGITAAVSMVVGWVNRLRNAWIDARIEASKYKDIHNDLAKADDQLAKDIGMVEKVRDNLKGNVTATEDTLGALLGAATSNMSKLSQLSLEQPGSIEAIINRAADAGSLLYEVLKKNAGLLDQGFAQVDAALLSSIQEWITKAQSVDLGDKAVTQQLVTKYMTDVLKVPEDVVSSWLSSATPRIQGLVDQLTSGILGLAQNAKDGATILENFNRTTGMQVTSIKDLGSRFADALSPLTSTSTKNTLDSLIQMIQKPAAERTTAAAALDAQNKYGGLMGGAASGVSPETTQWATELAKKIEDIKDPKQLEAIAGVLQTMRGLNQEDLSNTDKMVALLTRLPSSLASIFITGLAQFQGAIGTEAAKRNAEQIFNALKAAAESTAKTQTARSSVGTTSVTSDSTKSGSQVEIATLLNQWRSVEQRKADEQLAFDKQQVKQGNVAEKSFKLSVNLTKEAVSLLDRTLSQMKYMRTQAQKTGADVYTSDDYKSLQQQAQSIQSMIASARVSPAKTRGRNELKDMLQTVKDEFESQKAAIDAYYTYREDAYGKIIDMQDRTKTPQAFEDHLKNLESYIKKLEGLSTRGDSAFRARATKELERANLDRKKTIKQLEDAKLDIINEASLTKLDLLNLKLQEAHGTMSEMAKTKIFGEMSELNLNVVLNQLKQAGGSSDTYTAVASLLDRIKQSEQDANLSAADRVSLYNQMAQTVEQLLLTESQAADSLNPKVIQLLKELRKELGRVKGEFQSIVDSKAELALKVTLDSQEAMDQINNWSLKKELDLAVGGESAMSLVNNKLDGIHEDMNKMLGQIVQDRKISKDSDAASLQAAMDDMGKVIAGSLERELNLQQTASEGGATPLMTNQQIKDYMADQLDPSAIQEMVKNYVQKALDSLRAAGATDEQIAALDTSKLEGLFRDIITKKLKALAENLEKAHDELVNTIQSAWEEGFNIGFEHGFTEEGWKALKDSLIKRIGSMISQTLSKYISEVIADGLISAFQNLGLGDALSSSLGKMVGGLLGGIIGEVIGFFIGGLFNQLRDQADSMAEQQRKAQEDQVTASGFDWSYREAEKATPYYEFSPPVTQESVKIVKFVNNFTITTDAAMAMISQQRELERIITEIITNMNRTLAKTTGLVI